MCPHVFILSNFSKTWASSCEHGHSLSAQIWNRCADQRPTSQCLSITACKSKRSFTNNQHLDSEIEFHALQTKTATNHAIKLVASALRTLAECNLYILIISWWSTAAKMFTTELQSKSTDKTGAPGQLEHAVLARTKSKAHFGANVLSVMSTFSELQKIKQRNIAFNVNLFIKTKNAIPLRLQKVIHISAFLCIQLSQLATPSKTGWRPI